MKPVFLLTDLLLFALIAIVLCTAWHTMRHKHLLAPWQEMAKNPLAMAAAVFLGAYALIGTLDSLHYYPQISAAGEETRYATDVHSVFDRLVLPLKTRTETSYSAPLATHALEYATVQQPDDGNVMRQRPRLTWGGRHLNDVRTEASTDILMRLFQGLLGGSLCFVLVSGLGIFACAQGKLRRAKAIFGKICRNQYPVPWYAPLASFLFLCLLVGVLIQLSSGYHVLGTDKIGEDVLYHCLKSIRTGLIIGTVTTLIMLPFAIALGLLAGYCGHRVDDIIQYIYTTLNSIPGVLLIAATILLVQVWFANNAEILVSSERRADLHLFFLCAILGITSWTGLCRLLRGECLKLREMDYIQAARSLGGGHQQVLLRHLLPNVMHIVMIAVALDFSALVLAEAVLSYINIGVDPSTHSWGNMINSARMEMAREPVVWWLLGGAFLFMFVLVLSANLFADALRDAFDPRNRGARLAGEMRHV